MHFQIIKDEYYENEILNDINKIVPEFQSQFNSLDEIYVILGEFWNFMVNSIDNDTLINKSFEFINKAINHGGYKTEDLIVIEIFQQIYESEYFIERFKKYLKGKSIDVFNKFLAEYTKNNL